MAPLPSWLSENWFVLLQGIGIVAGLLFTGISIRHESKGRRISNLLALSAQHRDLWQEMQRRPELGRVRSTEVDLVAKPITSAEAEFMNLVIVHFNTGWYLAQEGSFLRKKALAADAKAFFGLPIPSSVWNQTKHERDPKFVRFIESSLAAAANETKRN